MDGREVHATLPEIGLTHRIRALFESTIRSTHGSQCPLLWRMYLNFLVGTDAGFLFPAELLPLPEERGRGAWDPGGALFSEGGAQDPGGAWFSEGALRTREGPWWSD